MKYNIDYHTTYSNTNYCGINWMVLLFYDYHTMQSCGSGYYRAAKIRLYKPALNDAIKVSQNYRDIQEAYHAVGAHERVHLNPEQIKIDNSGKRYWEREKATYEHQIEAIKAYWEVFGKPKNSHIIEKIKAKTGL